MIVVLGFDGLDYRRAIKIANEIKGENVNMEILKISALLQK